jgi:uncharacterized protein (TIGR03435 family)
MKVFGRILAICTTIFASLAEVIAITVAFCLVLAPAFPRERTADKLTFDAASIKSWDPTVPPKQPVMLVRFSPGRITAQCVNLEDLVDYAFNLLRTAPINGLPPSARVTCFEKGTDRFIVEATMPPNTTEAQSRQMMQTLLADRFKLSSHWEKKVTRFYALTVSKGGPKMPVYNPKIPVKPLACPTDDPGCHKLYSGPTVPLFANTLSFLARLDHPVIDKTGLRGRYDFALLWASDTAETSSAPSLTTALREQLGLEMKLQTGPVDVLVIDHVERPSGN